MFQLTLVERHIVWVFVHTGTTLTNERAVMAVVNRRQVLFVGGGLRPTIACISAVGLKLSIAVKFQHIPVLRQELFCQLLIDS